MRLHRIFAFNLSGKMVQHEFNVDISFHKGNRPLDVRRGSRREVGAGESRDELLRGDSCWSMIDDRAVPREHQRIAEPDQESDEGTASHAIAVASLRSRVR